jgi:phage head maturation protease
MPLTRTDPATRTLAVNPDKLTVRSVITTIDPDRAGDVVVPTGLRNADDYLLNPVVLWAHNRSQIPPIGVCEWIDVQPRRIVAETRFARGVPFAEDVFRLYEQGILRGWSIGFVPRRARRLQATDPRVPPGLRVEEWDLLEYSAVPIPENPGAVTVAINKGLIRDPVLCDWFTRGAKAPDVLAELVEVDEARHSE